MLRLKPFILLIIFLKQVVFLISASIQDPKNEIQKQSSMYSQSLPKEKLFILESEETQHESKFNNFAERLNLFLLYIVCNTEIYFYLF
jgi:hypothetical protein